MRAQRDARSSQWRLSNLLVQLLAGRWTLAVLSERITGGRRYQDLHDALDGISYKVLTETLRRAERDGLVVRHLDGARVETATLYELTELGRSLPTSTSSSPKSTPRSPAPRTPSSGTSSPSKRARCPEAVCGERLRTLAQTVTDLRCRKGELFLKVRLSRSEAIGSPLRLVKTSPLARQPGPKLAASARCRFRCALSFATVARSRAITRDAVRGLGRADGQMTVV